MDIKKLAMDIEDINKQIEKAKMEEKYITDLINKTQVEFQETYSQPLPTTLDELDSLVTKITAETQAMYDVLNQIVEAFNSKDYSKVSTLLEVEPKSDLDEIVTSVNPQNDEPSDMEVKGIKVESVEIKSEPIDIKLEPTEIKSEPIDIKLESPDIKLESPDIKLESTGVKSESTDIKLDALNLDLGKPTEEPSKTPLDILNLGLDATTFEQSTLDVSANAPQHKSSNVQDDDILSGLDLDLDEDEAEFEKLLASGEVMGEDELDSFELDDIKFDLV